MSTISEEIVEETWRRVAQLDEEEAFSAMEEVAKRQPFLLAYVMAYTADSRPSVQELALYLYYVVLQMFEASTPKRIKKVKESRVEHHISRNEAMLERLESAHDRFVEKAASEGISNQPYVFKYITEALFEDAESDPDLALTGDETGLVFLVLKVVVDALDEASEG